MSGIPDRDLQRIRKYASNRVPPRLHDQIQMDVDVRGLTVTIVECRPPWDGDTDDEWTREGVARMKFNPTTLQWKLYWCDSNERWHLFKLISPGSVGEILHEVERDQTNIFWG
jgi:hypothetical protein